MKNRYVLVICSVLLIISSSCDEVLNRFEYQWDFQNADLDKSAKEPQLCVNGFPTDFNPGLKIDVSEASDIDYFKDENEYAINNAIVNVFENGKKIGTLDTLSSTDSNGSKSLKYYHPNIIFKQNRDYEIEVSAPGYKTVKGKTSIPVAIKPDSLIATESAKNNKKGYLFTLYFTDPVNEKNYYMLNARSHTMLFHYSDTIRMFENFQIPLDDHIFAYLPDKQSFVREPFDISKFKPRMFSDETIAGKQFGLSFFMELHKSITWEQNERYVDKVEVFLISISKEMFEGLKSQYLFRLIRSDLYAEKMTIYSNMSNGIGLWGGYSASSITVKLNKKVNFEYNN